MYQYKATIVKVHDGDTVVADIDLGFYITMRASIRLAGINAPELTGTTADAGEASTKALMGLIGGTWQSTRVKGAFGIPGDYLAVVPPVIYVETSLTKQYEKYGRVLGTLYVDLTSPSSVNDAMVAGGFATVYP